ncbi:uncharacterized protein LOC125549417 [Triticum urartu]|uniref:uncharacterized protein LOC125549417 n=1 Tax=Triticum urartu TaxID=4572 RepID=UPI0020437AC1|nr:uncharacterized protein LOC125549417 [Triticum urartu]
MAAYYNGGRPMPYSNTDEGFDGGRTIYSTPTECYDASKHGLGTGHGHGYGGTNMYSNTTDVQCFDSSMHGQGRGGGGRTMYSNTAHGLFDLGRPGHGHIHSYGHNDGRIMSYTTTTTKESFGGGEQGQGYYKKEVKQHKNRELVGEVGAFAPVITQEVNIA